jgi:demethylmenaquinone methyltransferase/2-methoxy-6-polyprenyl-1,4-benzoquinol methylase
MSFASDAEKRQYVNTMFGRIAQHYDFMNRLMTLGQDVHWRRALVRAADLPPGGRLLDIATGTGDVAFTAIREQPGLKLVVGADFSLPMLGMAQKHATERYPAGSTPLHWMAGDTLCLPFVTDTFDAVTSAFLMRNVTDVAATLREQLRVARPGGRVLVLDVPRPAAHTLRGRLFHLYFHHLVPWLGKVLTGHRDAYAYLPSSADAFLTPGQLACIMETVGLQQVYYRSFMMGTVALHVGAKPWRL